MDYSPRTLAEKWGTRPQLVYGLIDKGELAAFNVALTGALSKRPVYRIAATEVERFEQTRTVAQTPAKPVRARRSSAAKFYA